MTDAYTENLADFGARERRMLMEILSAWNANGLPDDFSDDKVRPAFNRNSGHVFLVNDEYQTAMMNDGKLESFYSTPYEGKEGFWSDLMEEFDGMHPEDKRFMAEVARSCGYDFDKGDDE